MELATESSDQIQPKERDNEAARMAEMRRLSNRFKYFLTVWVFIENLMFSGLRAGWPALVYILKQEKIYSYLCSNPVNSTLNLTINMAANWRHLTLDNISMSHNNHQSKSLERQALSAYAAAFVNNDDDYYYNFSRVWITTLVKCDEQDAVFNQCFTIATASMALSALLYGQLNYKFGIRAPRLLSVVLFVIGALMIAFIQEDVPWLVFPGFILISSGGMALYLTNNQVSYLYTRHSAAVVGLLCGALEASSFVQTLIKIVYELGSSLRVCYSVLAILYLATLLSTFFFLPKEYISQQNEDHHGDRGDHLGLKNEHQQMDLDADSNLCRNELYFNGGEINQSKFVDLNAITNLSSEEPIKNKSLTHMKNNPNRKRNIAHCICSKTFLLYLFWACVVQIILAMCLGTFNPWLEFITNKNISEVSRLTDVLLYSMLGSPVLSLIIGLLMDWLNKSSSIDNSFNVPMAERKTSTRRALVTSSVSLGSTSVLSVVVCIFFIISTHQIAVVASIVLVIFRTALYSCGTAFLRIMYPTEYFGLLCGLMSLLAGSFSFLQYPMFLWVQTREQAWMEVFGLLGVLGFLSLVEPLYLLWKSKQCQISKC